MNSIERKQELELQKKIVNGIYNETLNLKRQPKIGQAEELLKNRTKKIKARCQVSLF